MQVEIAGGRTGSKGGGEWAVEVVQVGIKVFEHGDSII